MADIQYDGGYDTNAAEMSGGQVSLFNSILHWTGALSSVALVLGLVWWGYDLTVRDVADVPVVRALEGPARIQPEFPGGQLASHQGLAVNKVQSEGEAEGPAPQIVLAPSPVELEDSDIVLGTSASKPAQPMASVEKVSVPGDALASDPMQQARAEAEALAESIAAQNAPLDPLEPAAEETVASETIALAIPGVNRSPRPYIRPKLTQVRFEQSDAVAAAVAAALQEASVDQSPEALAPGTRLVQLGAFDDRETAEAEWDKISARFEDYMDGKKRVIQETQSGGRTFYRLRASGFDGLSASRRFCAVLVAANAVCIPILAR